jgi:lactosylceramide 4-alpha-galactosyltransferase
MEGSGGGGSSPAKEPSLSFWRRKTNVFVAMPTLLSLYFVGAGVAFIVCTRTFVSFHVFSQASQAPAQLFRVNSTFFNSQGRSVLVPEKPALQVLQELQAPPHTLRERNVDIFKAPDTSATTNATNATTTTTTNATLNASSSQPHLDPVDDQVAIEAEPEPEPEFMQSPAIKKGKLTHAAVLQRRLRRMSSVQRRRWVRQNWSMFKILKQDNVSEQFSDRMQAFFCKRGNDEIQHLAMLSNLSSSDPALTREMEARDRRDEASICGGEVGGGFCTQRFFLTWMSPVEAFSPRERLGLESVFKHHPGACVVVLSRTMDSEEGEGILAPFRARGYRVMAVTPDVAGLFGGQPAARWLGRLRDGSGDPGCINLMQNLSNLMRLAALYRYGGVYLDTDVVVLRSFTGLRNAVGAQSRAASGQWTRLNNAVLVFDRAHPAVHEFLREFAATFDGSRWGWNGPYLVSRVLHHVLLQARPPWANCSDVAVLPLQAFYPVNWIDIVKLFHKPTADRELKWQVTTQHPNIALSLSLSLQLCIKILE